MHTTLLSGHRNYTIEISVPPGAAAAAPVHDVGVLGLDPGDDAAHAHDDALVERAPVREAVLAVTGHAGVPVWGNNSK